MNVFWCCFAHVFTYFQQPEDIDKLQIGVSYFHTLHFLFCGVNCIIMYKHRSMRLLVACEGAEVKYLYR